MKIMISVDIKGIAGIAHWDEALMDREAYAEFRALMTAEAIAAIEGARSSGATEIIVRDAHQTARNLDIALLPPDVQIIRGWSGHPYKMVQGLDDSYDAVAMVGWHAPAADGGNPLSHTITGRWARTVLNGIPLSEYGLFVRIAASRGVPVVFLSGDAAICEEARRTNPAIETVATKAGEGASVASITPARARAAIEDGVSAALCGDLSTHTLPSDDAYRLEVTFQNHDEAFAKSFYPGARLSDPCTVTIEADTVFEAARALAFF